MTFCVWCQQNLVSNGNLEEYWECPYQQNDSPIRCTDWYMASYATSDYFNSCSSPLDNGCTVLCATVPANFLGFQYPRSGAGYCGFGAYFKSQESTQYKEYIGSKLIQPLEAGEEYILSFFVSLADSCSYATDQIGCHLSADSLSIPALGPSFVIPLINNSNGILSDKENWMEIRDTFLATGMEKYITIGSFGSYNNMQLQLQPIGGDTLLEDQYLSAYYYVDDITIYKVQDESNLPNVLTLNNDNINEYVDFSWYIPNLESVFILNRWGNLVYKGAKNSNTIWNGADWKTGEPCSDGTYFYVVETPKKKFSGFIQLIR